MAIRRHRGPEAPVCCASSVEWDCNTAASSRDQRPLSPKGLFGAVSTRSLLFAHGRAWSVCLWPVVAKVGIWEVLRPAVEDPGKRRGLPASRGEVTFQDECQDYITLSSKICHVLGDDSVPFSPGSRGHLGVVSRPQTYLCDVDSIPTIGISQ